MWLDLSENIFKFELFLTEEEEVIFHKIIFSFSNQKKNFDFFTQYELFKNITSRTAILIQVWHNNLFAKNGSNWGKCFF